MMLKHTYIPEFEFLKYNVIYMKVLIYFISIFRKSTAEII